MSIVIVLIVIVALASAIMWAFGRRRPTWDAAGCRGCRHYRRAWGDFLIKGHDQYALCSRVPPRTDGLPNFASVQRMAGFDVLDVCGPNRKHFEAKP